MKARVALNEILLNDSISIEKTSTYPLSLAGILNARIFYLIRPTLSKCQVNSRVGIINILVTSPCASKLFPRALAACPLATRRARAFSLSLIALFCCFENEF